MNVDFKKCVKCAERGEHHGVDAQVVYCRECFLKMVHHKFSYCLGKNRVFKSATAQNALIVYDGAEASALLLSLIHDGLTTPQTSRRLRINPSMVFLFTTDDLNTLNDQLNQFNAVRNFLDDAEWKFYFVHLAAVMDRTTCFRRNPDKAKGTEMIAEFTAMLKLIKDRSVRAEVKSLLGVELIARIARQIGCSSVVVAENAEALANVSFNALCLGRGAAISDLTAVVDNRLRDVQLVRPLRDICNREVQLYHTLKESSARLILRPASSGDEKTISHAQNATEGIQKLSMDFIQSLQSGGFPGTVATILSISSKLEQPKTVEMSGESTSGSSAGTNSCKMCRVKIANDVADGGGAVPACGVCKTFLDEVGAEARRRILSCYDS